LARAAYSTHFPFRVKEFFQLLAAIELSAILNRE